MKKIVFNTAGIIQSDFWDMKLSQSYFYISAESFDVTVYNRKDAKINKSSILTEADLGEYSDGGTIPVRGSTGAIAVPNPTHNLHAVNLGYLEANYVKK